MVGRAGRARSGPYRLVAVGGSWGGAVALRTVLAGLPDAFPAAVAAVLHRSTDSSGDALVRLLATSCPLPVVEVEDKVDIEPGYVYVAPADYHLVVEDQHFALTTDEPVRFSRPSIDVLLDSVADVYGAEAVAVILTGANDDGAAGVTRVHAAGGYVVVQDPATADRPEMPKAALDTGAVDQVATLEDIGPLLGELCGTTR